jgi:hypothetical protein
MAKPKLREVKKCESCRVVYNTWEDSSTCLDCRKIRFHMRKIIPEHIPLSQTRKFMVAWKDKYDDPKKEKST